MSRQQQQQRGKRRGPTPPASGQRQGQGRAAGQSRRRGMRRWWWLLPPLLLLVVGGIWWRWSGSGRPTAGAVGEIGGARCVGFPRFATAQGFSQQAGIDTGDTRRPGMTLVEQTNPPHTYQHPSWTQAGYLGPTTLDDQGNILVAPVPQTSLELNPLGQQNRVYRVDTNTAEMSLFADLPPATPSTETNPFGVMGLAVDCSTHSLYITSVAGSDRAHEVGRVFRVDLRSGRVTSQLDGIDAIGTGVYNGARGKRIYLGLARSGEVRSAGLDANGDFTGAVRPEFSIVDQSIDGNGRVRRIGWSLGGDMLLTVTPFTFTLAPPTSRQQLVYRYDSATDTWHDATPHP